jgi:hypothetical protein
LTFFWMRIVSPKRCADTRYEIVNRAAFAMFVRAIVRRFGGVNAFARWTAHLSTPIPRSTVSQWLRRKRGELEPVKYQVLNYACVPAGKAGGGLAETVRLKEMLHNAGLVPPRRRVASRSAVIDPPSTARPISQRKRLALENAVRGKGPPPYFSASRWTRLSAVDLKHLLDVRSGLLVHRSPDGSGEVLDPDSPRRKERGRNR